MDSKLLIMILLLMINRRKGSSSSSLHILSDLIENFEVDIKYTSEKVNVVKKIGPYFPDAYRPVLNKSIMFTEKILKLYEVVDFMKLNEVEYITQSIPVNNNKERLNRIVSIIQQEFPKEEVKNMGMAMDLILNVDKYKKMFNLLNTVMSSQESLKDTSQLINLIEPLMDGKNPKEKEKLKEMSKMIEIMKILDTPKKDKSKEE
ncbi:hypothetical protein KQI42_05545 [Tissierella sp. MSJ-40]|uniref:Uncharacterized protein n=1 Tax=Tissierella simiarum TaxID=2841534 RepID=A0ABS6E3H4_9FIRM|nr:hypothetical protein [Tissierella simiarum]MBU5437462.1 hypothetical protein [Tissierella simiarum]